MKLIILYLYFIYVVIFIDSLWDQLNLIISETYMFFSSFQTVSMLTINMCFFNAASLQLLDDYIFLYATKSSQNKVIGPTETKQICLWCYNCLERQRWKWCCNFIVYSFYFMWLINIICIHISLFIECTLNFHFSSSVSLTLYFLARFFNFYFAEYLCKYHEVFILYLFVVQPTIIRSMKCN